jgi:hypothetical protein
MVFVSITYFCIPMIPFVCTSASVHWRRKRRRSSRAPRECARRRADARRLGAVGIVRTFVEWLCDSIRRLNIALHHVWPRDSRRAWFCTLFSVRFNLSAACLEHFDSSTSVFPPYFLLRVWALMIVHTFLFFLATASRVCRRRCDRAAGQGVDARAASRH